MSLSARSRCEFGPEFFGAAAETVKISQCGQKLALALGGARRGVGGTTNPSVEGQVDASAREWQGLFLLIALNN